MPLWPWQQRRTHSNTAGVSSRTVGSSETGREVRQGQGRSGSASIRSERSQFTKGSPERRVPSTSRERRNAAADTTVNEAWRMGPRNSKPNWKWQGLLAGSSYKPIKHKPTGDNIYLSVALKWPYHEYGHLVVYFRNTYLPKQDLTSTKVLLDDLVHDIKEVTYIEDRDGVKVNRDRYLLGPVMMQVPVFDWHILGDMATAHAKKQKYSLSMSYSKEKVYLLAAYSDRLGHFVEIPNKPQPYVSQKECLEEVVKGPWYRALLPPYV